MSHGVKPLNLPEPTICDMNCFLPPGHEGPHQSEWKYRPCEACRGTGLVRKISCQDLRGCRTDPI